MKKELKKYLPFYLGCEVKLKEGLGALCLVGTLGSDSQKYHVLRNAMSFGQPFDFVEDKLILRSLSDMTEEEYWEADKLQMPIKEFGEYQFSAEQYHYLLSKHFDLFGLIDAGLAIDKTTLNKES